MNRDADDPVNSPNVKWPVRMMEPDSTRDAVWDIAGECPVALRYDGAVYAVMLATPADLEDFAIGFALSEGIIDDPQEIQSIRTVTLADGIELDITITRARAERLAATQRRRALTGSSGCGLCGVQSIDEIMRPLPAISADLTLSKAAIDRVVSSFPEGQVLNRQNSSVHGAAFADPQGNILCLREDIGRHNALDKLIGAVLGGGLDPADGFVFLSSRAGYELVYKAVKCGFAAVISISAPTAMAIRAAEKSNLTLASLNGDRLALFSRPERITPP